MVLKKQPVCLLLAFCCVQFSVWCLFMSLFLAVCSFVVFLVEKHFVGLFFFHGPPSSIVRLHAFPPLLIVCTTVLRDQI